MTAKPGTKYLQCCGDIIPQSIMKRETRLQDRTMQFALRQRVVPTGARWEWDLGARCRVIHLELWVCKCGGVVVVGCCYGWLLCVVAMCGSYVW